MAGLGQLDRTNSTGQTRPDSNVTISTGQTRPDKLDRTIKCFVEGAHNGIFFGRGRRWNLLYMGQKTFILRSLQYGALRNKTEDLRFERATIILCPVQQDLRLQQGRRDVGRSVRPTIGFLVQQGRREEARFAFNRNAGGNSKDIMQLLLLHLEPKRVLSSTYASHRLSSCTRSRPLRDKPAIST